MEQSAEGFVESRIERFYDSTIDEEFRYGAAIELAKYTKRWIERAAVPLDPELQQEAEAIAEAVDLLVGLASRIFPADVIDPFQADWLRLVSSDRAAGGEFGSQHYGREIYRRLRFLAFQRQPNAALELVGPDGEANIEAAPAPWRLQLLCLRAEIYRLKGEYELALADLYSAASRLDVASPLEQLTIYSIRFNVETDLGRLDRAEQALLAAARAAAALGGPRHGGVQNRLWRMRVDQQLSAGHHLEALRLAIDQIKRHESVPEGEANTANLDALDVLHYQAFQAAKECRPEDLSAEELSFASVEAATRLLDEARLSHFSQSAIAIDRIALLHASGRREEALRSLRELTPRDPKGQPIPSAAAETPLLAMRLAALRYEVTRDIGAVADLEPARKELHRAYGQLLDVWRSVALKPSGIGFLEFAARRRSLHTVLESVLTGYEDPGGAEAQSAAQVALAYVLAADACSTLSRRLGAPDLTPTMAIELCEAANATLVYVVPTPDATHRFTIHQGGVQHKKLEPESAFRERFLPLLTALRTPPSPGSVWPPSSTEPELKWLAERLVPASTGGTILYAGLDSFGHAPVEVLAGPDGLPIGLTHVVARVPSVNALGTSRSIDSSRLTDRPSMGIFAVTGGGTDSFSGRPVLPIPFSIAQYSALQAAVPDALLSYVGDSEGTERAFLDTLRAGPDLFVAVTHGDSGGASGGAPGIFVRGNEAKSDRGAPLLTVLTAESISRSLERSGGERPSVALLAACGAGAGPRRVGDSGSSDFSGSLLASGVTAVLAASDEIEVDAALAYVTAFSSAFLGGDRTVGEATLAARRSVAQLPGKSHPHFWASLLLYGWSEAQLKTH